MIHLATRTGHPVRCDGRTTARQVQSLRAALCRLLPRRGLTASTTVRHQVRSGAIRRSLVILMIVSGVAGWAVLARYGRLLTVGDEHSKLVLETVKRGTMNIKLTELGSLESANNVTLTCLVEGEAGANILKIVDEGTRVKKNQVLVEFDSSRLRDGAANQQIAVEHAAANLKNAEKNVEIQKAQSDSDLAVAKLALDLAILDLNKYKDGDLVLERITILGEIALAKAELTRAEDKYAFTQRLIRTGHARKNEVETDRFAVQKLKIKYEHAKGSLDVLDTFISRRQIVEKDANATEFERELVRVKLKADATLAKLEADLSASRLTYRVEKAKLDGSLRQIEVCTIRAPRDGLVVYANAPRTEGGRRGRATIGPLIFEGAKVQERQAIIHLPDLRTMQVNARIHESRISMVREGLPATIHVDAQADKSYPGVVETISLVPMSANRRNPHLREYVTTVRFTEDLATFSTLTPGLSAEVDIFSDRIPSALQAPVTSFVERGGRYFAWVVTRGRPIRHEVTVGRTNDQVMEILDGLTEGDKVVQRPRAVLPKEITSLEQEIPATIESPFSAP